MEEKILTLFRLVFIYYLHIIMTTNRPGYMRAYYESHKEQIRANQKAYYKRKQAEKTSNPRLFDLREDYKTPTREDFQAIPAKELTYSQKYYAENREKIREKQQKKRADDKRKAKQRAYYAEHRERILEQQRSYWAKKSRKKRLSKSFWGRIYLKIFG